MVYKFLDIGWSPSSGKLTEIGFVDANGAILIDETIDPPTEGLIGEHGIGLLLNVSDGDSLFAYNAPMDLEMMGSAIRESLVRQKVDLYCAMAIYRAHHSGAHYRLEDALTRYRLNHHRLGTSAVDEARKCGLLMQEMARRHGQNLQLEEGLVSME